MFVFQVPYEGFTYGPAVGEMSRHLTEGPNTLQLGGIGLVVPHDIQDSHPHLCGVVHVQAKLDTSKCNLTMYGADFILDFPYCFFFVVLYEDCGFIMLSIHITAVFFSILCPHAYSRRVYIFPFWSITSLDQIFYFTIA